jgi:hypothetical protein
MSGIQILDFVEILWLEEPQLPVTQEVSWISITVSAQFLSMKKFYKANF